MMVNEPLPRVVNVYVQFVVPVARCQLTPPSTETSTTATTPPPRSCAVPRIVYCELAGKLVRAMGDRIVEIGARLSVDCEARMRPLINIAGCTPISANR